MNKYTDPKISNTGSSWYVHFRYEGKQFRYKMNLNRIPDLEERQKGFEKLCKWLHSKLKNDWNPNIPDVISQKSDLYLIEALRFALDKKKDSISKKTISGYTGTINFLESAVKTIGLSSLKIADTKRIHIKLIIEQATKERKWSNKAHNKHLNHFKAILSELIQWDVIEQNPAFTVKNLPVSDADANTPASDQDVIRIKNLLQEHHFNFYIFVITIFHTGIRPEEILQIRLSMLDLESAQIILPPEITKTNKKRIVPINQHLLEYYKKMGTEDLPDDYFLFGSFRPEGFGNRGKFADFIPAPTHLKRDTATKRWERLIKIGLGINMNMYAMKHLGANKKILAGLDIDSLRELYGHSSKLMTEKYATVVKELHRKEILDKSPDF